MAVSEATDGYLLPCGRDVDQVWKRLDALETEQTDAHEAACPHCRSALRSLSVLRELTAELAAERTEPSIDLTGRIMASVRAEVRRRDLLPLPARGPGEVRVSAQAVAAVLRFAVDGVDGVRARRCRVTAGLHATDAAEELVFDVEMSLAVSYRGFARQALDEVRARMRAVAAARVGIRLGRLDLVLDDLYDDPPATDARTE